MTDLPSSGPLKRKKGDIAQTLTKAGLSAIPLVGGAAAELLTLLWEPSLSKRRDLWLTEIAEHLRLLEAEVHGFTLEEASKNEGFVTTAIQATQAAIRSHQKEKLDALRNAVLNSALSIALNEDLQLFFVSLIERVTVSHIQVLRVVANQNPYGLLSYESGPEEDRRPAELAANSISRYFDKDADKPESMTDLFDDPPSMEEIENSISKHQREREFLSVIVEDLDRQGLIGIRLDESLNKRKGYRTKVTVLGKEFLAFIDYPDCLPGEHS